MTARYTGWIRREGPNVVGEIADSWGWKIQLTGAPGEHNGVACFILDGTLGAVPETLRVPLLDDAPKP